MSVLIAMGVLLRAFQSGGVSSETRRKSLTTRVLYLMLPALVIPDCMRPLWR